MADTNRSPEELYARIETLEARIAELEQSVAGRKQVEEDLRESEERFRILFDNAPDAMFLADPETGEVLDANAAATRLLDRPREEIIGLHQSALHPIPREDFSPISFAEHVRQTQKQGLALSAQNAVVRPDGSEIPVEILAQLIQLQGKSVFMGTFRDITQRKQAEEALRAEKEFSEAIIQASVDTIFVFDPVTGKPFRWNRAFSDISGYTDEQIRAMKAPDDWYDEEDLKRAAAAVETITSEGQAITMLSLITKDGTAVPFEYVASSIKDEAGKLQYVVSIGRNISERRKAEQAFRESEERFRRFSSASFEGIVFTEKGVVIDANERMAKMLGCERTELLGEKIMDFVAPESRDLVLERIQSEYDTPYDHIAMKKDGTYFPVEVMGQNIPYHGRTVRVTLLRDITERKQAEEALRESERRYRLLFENMTTGFALHEMIYDAQGQPADYRYLEINPAFEKLTGVPVSALLGKTVKEVLPNTEQYWIDVSGKVAQTGEPVAYQNYAQELGKYYDTWLFSSEKDRFAVIFTDVTERVQTEAEIKQRNLELAALNDIASVVSRTLNLNEILDAALDKVMDLMQVDAAGTYLIDVERLKIDLVARRGMSEQFARELGAIRLDKQVIDAAMSQGESGHRILSVTAAIGDRAEIRRIRAIMRREGLRFESSIPVLLQAKQEILGVMMIASREHRRYSEAELQLLTSIGQQLAVAIQNAQLYEEVQHHADDLERRVTERTAELETANKELEALSRVKDEFVSNVSHELRTPITALKLHHHLLETHPDRINTYLPVLQREAERLHHIIEDLLRLSRLDQARDELYLTPVDLNVLANQYVTDRQLLAEDKGLSLSFAGEQGLPSIQADEGLLGQVLSILLTNALNFTPSGGNVKLSTWSREEDGQRWAAFSVSDTGPGISAGERPQLFERFFRGEVGRASGEPGTGLGLAIASEIVERHGGHIEVANESSPDEGATFVVWLPLEHK